MSELKVCQQCGIEFLWRPDPRPGRGRFCNRLCIDKWRSLNLVGDKSPVWKGRSGKNERRRRMDCAYTKKWAQNNKQKTIAHAKLAVAIRNGSVTRKPCEVCMSNNSEAHHPDYEKPLDVIWLCRIHHKAEHKRICSLTDISTQVVRSLA